METEVSKFMSSTSCTTGYRIVTALLFTSLILSTGFLHVGEVHGQSERVQQRWWNAAWQFRVPLMAVNSLNESVVGHPVFFYLELPATHVFSAVKEIRLIDSRGFEIPSYVLYEYRQDRFARGVYMLAFLSLPPNDARVLYVYYGNPSATGPWYRSTQSANVLDTDVAQIDLQDPVYFGPDVELRFGGSYPLTVSAKISYGTTSKVDYGSSTVAAQRFGVSRDWRSLSNMTVYGFTGASAELRGGGITLVRSLILRGGEVWISDLMVNDGTDPVSKAKYYFLLNASRLMSLGIPQGNFNPVSGLGQVSVGGTHIVVKNYVSAHAFQVSNPAYLAERTRQDSLDMSRGASGSVAFAFENSVDVLNPGDHVELTHVISIGSNMTRLSQRLNAVANSVRTYSLPEEILDTPIPLVTVGYDVTVRLSNLTLTGQGVRLDLNDASQISGSLRLEGRVSYELLGEGDRSFERPTVWRTSRNSSSTANVIASSSYWQDPVREQVGYISIWDTVGEGEANASLTTSWMRFPSVTAANLSFTYRADYTFSGVETPPTLYMAVSVDLDLDGSVDRSIILPVVDTEAGVETMLIGDGVWRQVTVDITDLLKGDDGQVAVEIFASTDLGFQGRLEFGVDDLQIQAEGRADRLVEASVDGYGQIVWLKLSGVFPIRWVEGDLDIDFTVLDSQLLGVLPDGVFESRFSQPRIQVVIASTPVDDIEVSRAFLVMRSGSLGDLVTVRLGDVPLELGDYKIHDGSFSVTGGVLDDVQNESFDVVAAFRFGVIEAVVSDVGGRPLSDVIVLLRDSFGRMILSDRTGADGIVTLEAVPSEYQVQFFYHDNLLSERSQTVTSKVTMNVQLQVYDLRFKVFSQMGFPIGGALVQLTSNNGTVLASGQTGPDGVTEFMNVLGKKQYEVSVYSDGDEVLKQVVNPSLDGVTVLLNTSYIPFSFTLVIVISLTGLAALTVIVMRRRLPKPRRIMKHRKVSTG